MWWTYFLYMSTFPTYHVYYVLRENAFPSLLHVNSWTHFLRSIDYNPYISYTIPSCMWTHFLHALYTGSLMKLNKVNRRSSPYSALRDYIAQLHIIGRLMRMRISGVVLTASSARAVASFYIWVQLHLLSKLFPPLYPTPLRLTLLRLYKTWLELDQYLEASPPVIYPQASDNRFIVRHKLITGCMCFPISSCHCAVLASGWSSSPPKGEVWRTCTAWGGWAPSVCSVRRLKVV